ncbi:SAP domain-containing protein [Streptococcus uberis]|nr:SAP domain-containing protein [Streptococcus uberis]
MNFFKNIFNKKHPEKDSKTESFNKNYSIKIGDIILLYWQDTSNSKDFPSYFEYDYKINPGKHTDILIDMGYLELQKSERSLAKLKVTELKDILKYDNLPTSGKKEILIQRIMEIFDTLESRIPSSLCLTMLGQELLNKNKGLILAHKDRYISPIEYDDYSSRYIGYSYDDIKKSILTDRIKINLKLKRFGLVRNDYLAFGEMYSDNKEFAIALEYYILTMLHDCSGLGNHYDYIPKPIYLPQMLNSYVVTKIRNCAEKCSKDEYSDKFEIAKKQIKSIDAKIFLTEKDFNFIKENILSEDLIITEKYLEKYNKYTFDYYN